jgi:hypothetical protein
VENCRCPALNNMNRYNQKNILKYQRERSNERMTRICLKNLGITGI